MNFETTFVQSLPGSRLEVGDGSGFNPAGGTGWYNVSGTWESFAYATVVNNVLQGVSNTPIGNSDGRGESQRLGSVMPTP